MRSLLAGSLVLLAVASPAAETAPYADLVREDAPVAWWRFDTTDDSKDARLTAVGEAGSELEAKSVGDVKFAVEDLRPEIYPTFSPTNDGIALQRGGRIVVKDPGSDSPLDFDVGDAITIEAWVRPDGISNGQTQYVLGKGRTQNRGVARDNQNYALRLVGKSGRAGLSFLFRAAEKPDWHRWDSEGKLPFDDRWHHVAVTYEFGQPDSVRGYVDGQPLKGTWDTGYAGTTTGSPVVDDDELWIGSSMGGSPNSSLHGGIDEVALYRKALPAERIKLRYVAKPPQPYVRTQPLPEDRVLVEVFEGVGDSSQVEPTKPPTTEHTQLAFGFPSYPVKYDDRGLRTDRKTPLLFRATSHITLPRGEYELLVRTRGDARLRIDGEERLHAKRLAVSTNAHGRIIRTAKVHDDDLHPVWPGDEEHLLTYVSDGEPHVFELAMVLGERSRRPDPGETTIAFRQQGEPFAIATPTDHRFLLTHDGWYEYAQRANTHVDAINRERRATASAAEAARWNERHERVRAIIAEKPSIDVPPSTFPEAERNEIDRFINVRLKDAEAIPNEALEDWAFLRRVTVDAVGTIPTEEQITEFLADTSPNRRERYVDRLLASDGWADNWVGYWQDVLAENPNVLKPTLNNTGPFRWWIHESFADNRPFDRFVTELVTMRGSRYYGGPNGFEMASQNDVPMAAKAHVVAQAFLGAQMKCARCHDAPFRDFEQRQLFQLAAMLGRKPQSVPKSSSVPGSPEDLEDLIVKVSLKPGSSVAPEWPFPDLADVDDPMLDGAKDSRERLAALVTSPHNERFARVVVNRLWKRYTGRGFVEPVDDWGHSKPSHPELLDWLAREFVTSGYDLKHVARLILVSDTYQRSSLPPSAVKSNEPFLFAGPLRRRMSAEQIVDSMFVAAGKDLKAGELNFDVDGANNYSKFLNLGRPSRAWHFTSLSNERDRPSLSLPFAQDFVDHLETFGWRSSRQDPLTERDTTPAAVQPAMMANGIVTGRVTRLSDDAELTETVLDDQPVHVLVERLTRRFLTREPSSEERELFAQLLEPGYADRRTDVNPRTVVRHPSIPQFVSWSNHLSPEANEVKIALEKRVRAGDPPSVRLQREWRLRAEDVAWALVNSPEFVFLP